MNRKETEKYKIQTNELVCVPSGLISEDGTDIMSWTLKEFLSDEELKDKEVYTLNEIEHIFCIKEDDEEYYTNSNYNSKHDKLFKLILSDKIEAAKFMNKVLKMEYKIKSEKMELYNKEYITTMFEKMESDIVYKIAEKNTYIIIEHQSTVDRTMPYRIFQYTGELLRNVIDKEKMKNIDYKQPRIISIVLYTGDRTWNIEFIDDLQEPLAGYPKVKPLYRLVDVNKFSKSELLEDNLIVSKAMLIEKEKSIEGILKALEQINKKLSINSDKRQMQLFITIVRYVLLSINDEETRKKLEKEIEKMKGVEANMLHATMVLNEEIKERTNKAMADGRVKGRTEGRKQEKIATAKRLLKKKIKLDFISEITGLSIKEIKKLKEE